MNRPFLLMLSLMQVRPATYVYLFSIGIGVLGGIAAFLFSIVYCWRTFQPKYMQGLPPYFFLSLLTEILGAIYHGRTVYIYWFFTIFESLFFSQFFLQLLPSRQSKGWVRGLAAFFGGGVAIFAVLVPTGWLLTITVLFESLIIVHQCGIYYLTEGLNHSIKYPPKRDPGLWMVTGILFYFLIQLPVIWYTAVFKVAHNEEMALVVYSLNNYAGLISSIMYIKAMTCLVKPS